MQPKLEEHKVQCVPTCYRFNKPLIFLYQTKLIVLAVANFYVHDFCQVDGHNTHHFDRVLGQLELNHGPLM